MPVNIPLNDGLAVFRHRITGDNEDMLCTLGIGVVEPTPGSMQLFVNSLFDHWKTSLDTSFPNTVTFVGCTFYWQQPGGFVVINSTSATAVGTSSGTSAPPNVAVIIRKQTSLGGRRGRGRMFLPGITETFMEPNGNLTSAGLTQLTTDVNALFTALSNDNGVDDLLLFHNSAGAPIDPTPITSFGVDAKVATQKRRLR